MFVCSGKDCKKNGSKKLHKALEVYIKEKKLKNKVGLVKMKCTGNCHEGPTVIHNNIMIAKAKAKHIVSKLDKK